LSENAVAKILERDYHYHCYPSRGSRGIDLICLAPPDSLLPHLGLEVGTKSKSVRAAFAKMAEARRYPGMIFMVVRKLILSNRIVFKWHPRAGFKSGYFDFEKALEEARSLYG